MSNIKVNLPADPFSGQIVTFPAPCDCASVTDGLSINGEIYTVCDAMGKCVTGVGGAWAKGAQVSVVLDCENKKAYIQSTGSYAPAGYGLGAVDPTTLGSISSDLANGWFNVTNTTSGRPSDITHAILNAMRYYDDYVHVLYEKMKGLIATRNSKMPDGVWEYVNPPMVAGVEYRTTERYLGKPVYVSAWEFGSLPTAANERKRVGIAATTRHIDRIIEWHGTVNYENGSPENVNTISLPCDNHFSSDKHLRCLMTFDGLDIRVASDFWGTANHNVTFFVKYTKTTD